MIRLNDKKKIRTKTHATKKLRKECGEKMAAQWKTTLELLVCETRIGCCMYKTVAATFVWQAMVSLGRLRWLLKPSGKSGLKIIGAKAQIWNHLLCQEVLKERGSELQMFAVKMRRLTKLIIFENTYHFTELYDNVSICFFFSCWQLSLSVLLQNWKLILALPKLLLIQVKSCEPGASLHKRNAPGAHESYFKALWGESLSDFIRICAVMVNMFIYFF